MATTVTVELTPEAWINDYAVPVDPPGDTEWTPTTRFLLKMLRWSPRCIASGHFEADEWRRDPSAPAWVRRWSGPSTTHVHIESDDPFLDEAASELFFDNRPDDERLAEIAAALIGELTRRPSRKAA